MGWSFWALRNEWNRRKHKVAVRADGTPWLTENSKEVYANGCRNLCEALSNWDASQQGRAVRDRRWDSLGSRQNPVLSRSFRSPPARCGWSRTAST